MLTAPPSNADEAIAALLASPEVAPLVADHRWLHPVPVTPHQVEVRVTDARGGDPHQRLVVGWNRDVDVLDPQRPVLDSCRSNGYPSSRGDRGPRDSPRL